MKQEQREELLRSWEERLNSEEMFYDYEVTVEDVEGEEDYDCIDDGFCHCTRNGIHFCLYGGQVKSERELNKTQKSLVKWVEERINQ